MTESDRPKVSCALAAVLLAAACGSSIESNTVADAPPVDSDREVAFHQEDPDCDLRKVGDLRVKASDWPGARPEAEETVRGMGGEAVVGWEEREVVVDPGGGQGSGVPGASGSEAVRDVFYFGVVVRFQDGCPSA